MSQEIQFQGFWVCFTPRSGCETLLANMGMKVTRKSSHLTHAFVEKQVGARGEIESVSWAAVCAQLAMIPCSSCDLGVSRQDWFSAGKCEVPKLFQCWKRGWPQQLSVNKHGNEISTICSCPWEFPLPCNIIRKYLPENHPETPTKLEQTCCKSRCCSPSFSLKLVTLWIWVNIHPP